MFKSWGLLEFRFALWDCYNFLVRLSLNFETSSFWGSFLAGESSVGSKADKEFTNVFSCL
jgi:hypothetical protein